MTQLLVAEDLARRAVEAQRAIEEPTSSTMARMASTSWVASRTVSPQGVPQAHEQVIEVLFRDRIDARRGSSRIRTRGSSASARAMKTRCCWPPDIRPIGRDSSPASPTRSSASATISRSRGPRPASDPDPPVAPHHDDVERGDRERGSSSGPLGA
jgi:hypothetical protein